MKSSSSSGCNGVTCEGIQHPVLTEVTIKKYQITEVELRLYKTRPIFYAHHNLPFNSLHVKFNQYPIINMKLAGGRLAVGNLFVLLLLGSIICASLWTGSVMGAEEVSDEEKAKYAGKDCDDYEDRGEYCRCWKSQGITTGGGYRSNCGNNR